MTTIARHQSHLEQYDVSWTKYTIAHRPGWTWTPPNRQQFKTFSTVGKQLILAFCGAMMLVLLAMMA